MRRVCESVCEAACAWSCEHLVVSKGKKESGCGGGEEQVRREREETGGGRKTFFFGRDNFSGGLIFSARATLQRQAEFRRANVRGDTISGQHPSTTTENFPAMNRVGFSEAVQGDSEISAEKLFPQKTGDFPRKTPEQVRKFSAEKNVAG